jgi:hypothetical protein
MYKGEEENRRGEGVETESWQSITAPRPGQRNGQWSFMMAFLIAWLLPSSVILPSPFSPFFSLQGVAQARTMLQWAK